MARPRTFVLGNIPNSVIYRSIDQYPIANRVSGVLILQIDGPIYFANASYLREKYTLQDTKLFINMLIVELVLIQRYVSCWSYLQDLKMD